MKRRDAFTLTELLVAVAVGSLLAITLLPTLQSDRETLRRAICANNLREIGQAMIMYSDDFRGSFPSSAPLADESGTVLFKREVGVGCPGCNPSPFNNVGGFTAVARLLVKHQYLSSPAVFVCPSAKVIGISSTPVSVAPTWQAINWNNLSYFYVVKMTTQWPTKSGAATTNRFYMLCADRSNASSVSSTPDLDPTSPHGTDGRNVLFTDSHVQWINGPAVSFLFSPIQADWGAYGIDNPATSPQVLGQQDHI
jgi:prepilin-type N-terminal cleavage/methylation domain-containing protein